MTSGSASSATYQLRTTYCLLPAAYYSLLTTHYLQGATRAASRLAAVQFTDDSAHHSAVPFVVPPDRVRLVACAASAAEFAAAMAALALDGALAACRDGDGCRGGTLATCRGTLALDAEWRPDVGASCHLPSLVQAATPCTFLLCTIATLCALSTMRALPVCLGCSPLQPASRWSAQRSATGSR